MNAPRFTEIATDHQCAVLVTLRGLAATHREHARHEGHRGLVAAHLDHAKAYEAAANALEALDEAPAIKHADAHDAAANELEALERAGGGPQAAPPTAAGPAGHCSDGERCIGVNVSCVCLCPRCQRALDAYRAARSIAAAAPPGATS